GSSEGSLDAEALLGVQRRCVETVEKVMTSFGGSAQELPGGSLVAFFGVPKTHEDDPIRAVRAAAAASLEVHRLSLELPPGWNRSLRLRIGIDTGRALCSEAPLGSIRVTGEAVVSASRLK